MTKIKKIISLFALTFSFIIALYLSAGEKQKDEQKNKNEGDTSDFEGAFTIKNWDKDLKLPEVKDDKKNILIEEFTENEIAKIAKVNGLASILKIDKKISWKPLWRYVGAGSVNLPAITISNDKSLIAIVERTGEQQGPNGSRIILIRTADRIVARIHELKQKKVNKIAFIPDSDQIILSTLKQPEIKEFNEILTVNIESGEILKSKKYRNSINDIIVCGEKIIAAFYSEDNKTIDLYEIYNDTLAMNKKFQSENITGILCHDKNNEERFLYASDKYIEIFLSSANKPIAKIASPEAAIPDAASFLTEDNTFIVSYKGGNAWLIRGENKRPLMEKADSIIAFNKKSSTLLLSSIKNDKAILFKLPEYEEIDSFSISSLKPRTRGDLIFSSFIDSQTCLFIDDQGNIFSCKKSGKKWKKEIHIEAMK